MAQKRKRTVEALELESQFLNSLDECEVSESVINEIREDLKAADVYRFAFGMSHSLGYFKSTAGEKGIEYLLAGENPDKVMDMLDRNFKNSGRLSLSLNYNYDKRKK